MARQLLNPEVLGHQNTGSPSTGTMPSRWVNRPVAGSMSAKVW